MPTDEMLPGDDRDAAMGWTKSAVAKCKNREPNYTMTRDNNESRKKANAVFFSVIMVISMAAIGFAAAPAAAADTDADNVTIEYEFPDDGTAITEGTENVEPEVTISVDEDADNNLNQTSLGDADELAFFAGEDQTDIIEGIDFGDIDIAPGESETFTFDDGAASDTIENLDPGVVTHQVALVDVDENDPSDNAIVTDGDGDEYTSDVLTLYVGGEDDSIDTDDFDRLIDVGVDESIPGSVYQGQTFIFNVDGADAGELQLRSLDDEQEAEGPGPVLDTETFLGEEYVIVDTTNRAEGQFAVTDGARGTSGTNGDANVFVDFEHVAQDLDFSFDEDEVDNQGDTEVEFEIESDFRNAYAVEITADGLDEEDLESIFAGDFEERSQLTRLAVHENFRANDNQYFLDEDEESIILSNAENLDTADFDDIDADDYEFEVNVFDTTAEDSASIEVAEGVDGEVEFVEDDVEVEQGGVANITLEATGGADEAQLAIGDDDIGYELNATVDFDGEDSIELAFNTYAAGTNNTDEFGDVLTVESDDGSVDYNESSTEDLLDEGGYQLAVSAGTGADFEDVRDDPDNLGEVFIEERTIDDWNTWITPADSDIEDADDIVAGIEAGNVTENDVVAHGDIMVHQIEATGLEGIFASAQDREDGADDESEAFLNLLDEELDLFENDGDDSNFDLRIRETRDSAGPNTERLRVDAENSSLDVIVEEDSVFIVMDTDEVAFDSENFEPRIDNLADETDEDFEFDVRFRNQDVRLLEFDDDDEDIEDVREQLDAQFEVEEAFFDFDQDPYNVTASDDVVFEGDTNAAPGSEFDARVRSTGETSPRFNINEDASVDEDQNWESDEFDLTETSAGDTFQLELRSTIADDRPTVDGNVVDDDAEPAFFEVSDLDPADAEVEIGDVIDASATITNTGDEDGVKDVEFRVDGDTIDTQEVELEAGEEVTGEFEIDTSDLAAGDYEHSVWTEDDEEVGSLTIVDPDADDDDEPADDGVDDTDPADDADDEEPPADDVDDDTPGFGALVALVALIAAALLATRRRP